MPQTFGYVGDVRPAALEHGGERVPGRIRGHGGQTHRLGYPAQYLVAFLYDRIDKVLGGEAVLLPRGELEDERAGVSVVGVAPAVHDFPHLGGEHRTYGTHLLGSIHRLCPDKTDFTVHDVSVSKIEHVPEVDAVAEVGEEPHIPVKLGLLPPVGIGDEPLNLFQRECQLPAFG